MESKPTLPRAFAPTFATFACLAAGAACPLPAWALAQFGGGKLDLDTTLALTHDTRVRGVTSGEADTYVSLEPTFQFTRPVGLISVNSTAGVRVNRFFDNTSLDDENFFASASATIPPEIGGRLTTRLSAGYTEKSDVDPFELTREKSKTYSFDSNVAIDTSPRTQAGGHARFSTTDRERLSDQDRLSLGAFFLLRDFLNDTDLQTVYNYASTESSGSGSLDIESHTVQGVLTRPLVGNIIGNASLGHRTYQRTLSSSAGAVPDLQDGLIYSAGISGPFLPPAWFPNLTSSANISYENSETPGTNDTGGARLAGRARIEWTPRERTSVAFSLSRSQQLTAADLSVVSSDVSLDVTQKILDRWQAVAGLGYSWNSYENLDRDEQVLRGNASLSYSFVERWSAALSYRLEDRSSDNALRDYVRHVISLSGTVSF